jgi:phosphoenolpyruvate synthase/pyruvate phosphate dikinase
LIPTTSFQHHLEQKLENETLLQFIKQQMSKISKDLKDVQEIGKIIREKIESSPVSDKLKDELRQVLSKIDPNARFAVRSSATMEDLGDFSFAGQHDTYLHIKPDLQEILQNIRKCWASVFSDRAIMYRKQNGIDDIPLMCVVVQEMVYNVKYSGIMFTADPLTNDRDVIAIDASYGLGEALVSGLVSADSYRVKKSTKTLFAKRIAEKKLIITVNVDGKLEKQEVPTEQQNVQAMNDDLILQTKQDGSEKSAKKPKMKKFAIVKKLISPILLWISLGLHSLFEGLGLGSVRDEKVILNLTSLLINIRLFGVSL